MNPSTRTAAAAAAVLFCLCAAQSVAAQTGVWRVGSPSDPDCDFSDVQSAIDATQANDGGFSTINVRVSGDAADHLGNTYFIDAAEFDNVDVFRIIGGHGSCSDASPTTGERTVLDADQGGRVFELVYTAVDTDPVRTIILDNLEITGGNADFAGGGIRIRGHSGRLRARLQNVDVNGNVTRNVGSGGGISLEATAGSDSPTTWFSTDQNTLIRQNVADGAGGGLACFHDGSANPPVILFNTLIMGNEARFDGGGVSVNGCRNVHVRTAGTDFAAEGSHLFDRHIGHNSAGQGADGNGGGIYLTGEAEMTVEASGTEVSAIIFNNTADHGGGIAVEDGSELLLVNTRIHANTAHINGGGIHASGAELTMGRHGGVNGFVGDCQPQFDKNARCSVLSSNSAGADGGAIAVEGQATAVINQTFVHGNSSAGGRGSVAFVGGQSTLLELEGAVVHSNKGSTDLFHVRDAGILEFHWTSLAGNREADEDLRVFRVVDTGDGTPILSLSSSIIWEPGAELASQSGTPFTTDGCVIGHLPHNESGLDEKDFNTFYSFIDPRLRDPANGDLRLRPDSPAVDYCDLTADPTFNDMFNNPRGVDVGGPLTEPPNQPNGDHDFDIGAHELQSLQLEIFSDRFES